VNTDRLQGMDVEAIAEAVERLDDAGVQVQMVSDVNRSDDGRTTFQIRCVAETRTMKLGDHDSQ